MSLFEEIVKESCLNENIADETTRRQKAQRALQGKNANIKTICIMSAENPLGQALTPQENKPRREDLEIYCTNAHYPWFRIKGKYGSNEKSHMIYNITLSDAIKLGQKFNQESIIFIEVESEDSIRYEYWEQVNHDGHFIKTHERRELIDMSDADDFYSMISKNFKFQIPFFDGSDDKEAEMNEQIDKIAEKVESKYLSEDRKEKYLKDIVNEEKTGICRYNSRGSLFGGWKGNTASIEEDLKEYLQSEMLKENAKAKTEKENIMERFFGIASNGLKPIIIEHITLDRIIKKHGDNGYIIISANRSDIDKETNDANTQKLYNEIKKSGYSFLPAYGGYRGRDGVEDDYEPSFIVFNYSNIGEQKDFNILRSLALKWCGDYNQDSVMIKAPDSKPMYIDRNGKKANDSESYNYWKNDPNRAYFTSLKPRTEVDPQNPNRRFTLDIGFNGDDGLVHECIFINPGPCTLNERRRRANEIMF